MSLINDALKRTEESKANSAPIQAAPAMLSVPQGPARPSRIPLMLAALMAIMGALGAWLIYSGISGGAMKPKTAQATQEIPTTPVIVSNLRQEKTLSNAEMILAKTLDSVRYYHPGHQTYFGSGPSGLPDTDLMAEVSSQNSEQANKAATAKPKQAAAAPTAPTPPPMPQRSGAYKLSGIMAGPSGKTAIINGKFVNVGQTVDGAKIISIGQYTVELEIDGQSITIQL